MSSIRSKTPEKITSVATERRSSNGTNLQLILKPRLSEKAYGLSQTNRTYVFDVLSPAGKQSIGIAVEQQFGVSVTNVNVTNIKGKAKRTFVSKRGKFVRGTRSDVKKAYVTLQEGDSIPIFAAEEEAEAKAQKAEEKAAKKAKKEKS